MFLQEVCLWTDQILDIGNANINVRNNVYAHFTSFSRNHWCCRAAYCPSVMLYFLSFQSHMPLLVAALHTEQRCWFNDMTGFSLLSLWSCCVHSYSCALSLSDCILHGSIQASKPADIAQLWFQQNRLNKIFLFSVVSFFISSNRRLFFSVLHTWQFLSPWLIGAKVSSYCGINSWAVIMGPICTSWWLKPMCFTLQWEQMNCMGWTILSDLLTDQTLLSCCNWVITQSCGRVLNSCASVQRRVVNSR